MYRTSVKERIMSVRMCEREARGVRLGTVIQQCVTGTITDDILAMCSDGVV